MDTDNHHEVIGAVADELQDDQLDSVTGGLTLNYTRVKFEYVEQ
jgi:hypothetical protein